MLPLVAGFRTLNLDLQPQGGFRALHLARVLVDRHMKILRANLALRFLRADQARERFEDGSLARPVRPKNIGQIAEIDCRWFRAEGLKITQPQRRDHHRRSVTFLPRGVDAPDVPPSRSDKARPQPSSSFRSAARTSP